MHDGMNPEESLEVIEIQKLCMKLNHKQIYSLLKSLAWDLRRMIDYLDEKNKTDIELWDQFKNWIIVEPRFNDDSQLKGVQRFIISVMKKMEEEKEES